MKNFTLNIPERITRAVTLSQYFTTSSGVYYKLLDEKTYLNVVYYGDDLLSFGLYFYPKIEMHSTELLHGLRIDKIKEITDDEFYSAYFEARNLIEKLANL
jgi:hypothetical protein